MMFCHQTGGPITGWAFISVRVYNQDFTAYFFLFQSSVCRQLRGKQHNTRRGLATLQAEVSLSPSLLEINALIVASKYSRFAKIKCRETLPSPNSEINLDVVAKIEISDRLLINDRC